MVAAWVTCILALRLLFETEGDVLVVDLWLLLGRLKLLREAHLARVEWSRCLRSSVHAFVYRVVRILVKTDAHLSGMKPSHGLVITLALSLGRLEVV